MQKQAVGMLSARSSAQRPDIAVSGGGKHERPSGAHTEYLNGGRGRGVGVYICIYKIYISV